MNRMTRRTFLGSAAKAAAVASAGGAGLILKGCSSKKSFDLVIKGGIVLDGLGTEGYTADIGVRNRLIDHIGRIDPSRAKTVVEAEGLSVAPGFIDVHDHTSFELLVNPRAESAVRQGVTTLIAGNCGDSAFPVSEPEAGEMRAELKEYGLDASWHTAREFFTELETAGTALNYASLTGHGTLRTAVMGRGNRKPSREELAQMKAALAEAIEQGALGLSTGLEYTPGSFADTEELIGLAGVAGSLDGIYATHMRDEQDFVLEALEEAIRVARESKARLQVSHFKIGYPQNWPKLEAAIARLEQAQREGIDIFADRYPYIAGSTGLSNYFPIWSREGTTEDFIARLKDPALQDRLRAALVEKEQKLGSWDRVLISHVASEANKSIEGKTVLAAAGLTGKSPYEFMRDLLIEEKGRVGMISFTMKEENLKRILSHALVGVGADGSAVAPYGPLAKGKPHPRLYGTFPRVLGKYVREEKLAPLEEMIRKITSIPARRFKLGKRGRIERSFFADLVVFDRDKVADRATWTDPQQYPVGIEYVIVNGQVVVERGDHTGRLPGRVLRRGEAAEG